MEKIYKELKEKNLLPGQLTIGDCIGVAKTVGTSVGEVIIAEAMEVGKMTRQEVLSAVMASFSHNLYAIEIGTTTGSSFLMGNAGRELTQGAAPQMVEALLWVEPSTGYIRRARIVDFYGNSNDVRFTQFQPDTSLKASDFTFTAPKGVEVEDRIDRKVQERELFK